MRPTAHGRPQRLVGLVAALAMLTATDASAQSDGPWQVGSRLPDLELPRIDGAGVLDLGKLGEHEAFAGKRILLIEFASW